jgi:hypothetical protein
MSVASSRLILAAWAVAASPQAAGALLRTDANR